MRVSGNLVLVAITLFTLAPAESQDQGGLKRVQAAADLKDYGRKWAVIVGINYTEQGSWPDEESRRAVPALKNAENDAQALRDVLTKYFGYKEGPLGENVAGETATLVCLCGKDATAGAVDENLTELLRDKVSENDSVLFFFAGHGVRLEGSLDRGAILPVDVQMQRGEPVKNYIRLHSDLLEKLKRSKARHKLIILDACHSGEIFKIGAQPAISNDARTAEDLFERPVIQAIASCRAFQFAADGESLNSPFSAELVRALKQLPARAEGKAGEVTTHQLFKTLVLDMKSIDRRQEPECRNLGTDDGEFRFVPGHSASFDEFRPTLDEWQLLQVTIASEQGEWWFDDIPWFIPALRNVMLNKLSQPRNASGFSFETRQALVEAGRSYLQGKAQASETPREGLDALRHDHALQLLSSVGRKEYRGVLRQIVKNLEAERAARSEDTSASRPSGARPSARESLSAEDFHLLAIANHKLLEKQKALEAFHFATSEYQKEIKKIDEETDKVKFRIAQAMFALCKADQGHCLLELAKQPKEAAEAFHEALVVFGNNAPPAFRTFVLRRESDALLNLNRFGEANQLLQQATKIAFEAAPRHFITADAYRWQAWAHMRQWQITLARESFLQSNRILRNILGDQVGPSSFSTSGEAPAIGSTPAVVEGLYTPIEGEDEIAIDDVMRSDLRRKIVYLHNFHGLAMVARFQGEGPKAAATYRELARQIENSLQWLRENGGQNAADGEKLLYERLVNTLERLGDCNLFGHPDARDLREAYDDYRRASALLHRLDMVRREGTHPGLYFKQALALALASENLPFSEALHDLGLAEGLCKSATDLCDELTKPPTIGPSVGQQAATPLLGGLAALRELTPAIVSLAKARAYAAGKHANPNPDQPCPCRQLRIAIRDFYEENEPLERDQLEVCLVASKLLVDYGGEEDRHLQMDDVDLLMRFCRLALVPHTAGCSLEPGRRISESRAYLRSFYDSAMRGLLRSNASVKGMLEVQYEATRGAPYVKERDVAPILAIYLLDGRAYLLMDLPGGASRSVALADVYDHQKFLEACVHLDGPDMQTNPLLGLPLEIARQLEGWQKRRYDSRPKAVHCWCEDESILLSKTLIETLTRVEERATTRNGPFKRIIDGRVRFPFALPPPFEVKEGDSDSASVRNENNPTRPVLNAGGL